ncbi:MAG: hypothetical protein IID46_07040, partial [Planctomycetes bacterium]|nr:hypothetical protein [Planctomycetota bacterium]
LFDQIEKWIPEEIERDRSETPHTLGQLSKQYDLDPVRLPSLTLKSDKNSIRFYPSALLMLGANGRIDVFKDGSYLFQILDRSENGSCRWQIVGRDARHNLTSLTKESLRKSLKLEALNSDPE